MAYGPQDSAIKVSSELEKQISETGSMGELLDALHQAALDQRLVVPDAFDNSVLLEVERPAIPANAPHARVVVVNGVKHVLEARTEQELNEREIALYREQQSGEHAAHFRPQPPHSAAPARDPNTGKFVSSQDSDTQQRADEQRVVEMQELETQFRLGQVSPAEYLQKSGAFEDALRRRGIDPEILAEQSAAADARRWQPIVDEFLAQSDWSGGAENLQTMGELLLENHLEPSVENLRQAYEFMKANNLVKANAEYEAEKRQREAIESATSLEDIRAALNSAGYRDPHGLWGAQ